MNYEQCVDYILSIPLFGKKDGHNNTKELLQRLGNPHNSLKYIHVAGTNGKGSVCSMLSYIYVEAGYQVGFFSSPHLMKINERFKINNVDIEDEEFVEMFMRVKIKIDQMVEEGLHHPTFFETLFCMSICYFSSNKVDIILLETGLGGRLDATNLIEKPLVSVITQIGLDHVSILGDTLEKIAYEKGGIIKMNCPTVLQSDQKSVIETIEGICQKNHSTLQKVFPLRHKILKRTYKTIDFSINNKYYNYDRLKINTTAPYQILNVGTALTTLHILEEKLNFDAAAVRNGLEKFYWPGRMEIINEGLLLDGAHNESGIKAFVENINLNFKDRKIILLFAAMKDKAYDEMIQELSNCSQIKKILITRIHEERCLEADNMKATFQKYMDVPIILELDLEKALKKYYRVDDYLICCVGSLYLVGEIKKMIAGGVLND